jgi:hypothetical protein
MMDEKEYGNRINVFISNLTNEFIKNLKPHQRNNLKAIILTGSFASWLKGKKNSRPSWSVVPDVNYYPFIRGAEEDIIQFGYILHKSIKTTTKKLQKENRHNYNIILDLHPFSISSSKPIFKRKVINIQLTTRIINLDLYERYPDYSWFGWYNNYLVLYPNIVEIKNILPFSITHPKRDERWLRNMYLALLSYGNVLQVLPLYTIDKEHIIFEVYRYLKEIAKDGVSIALTNEEFKSGKLYTIITNWRNKIINFYKERYGKEASSIVKLLVDMDKNYAWYLKTFQDPTTLIEKAILLRNIVFEKGVKRRLKEIPLKKVMFESLPLWW